MQLTKAGQISSGDTVVIGYNNHPETHEVDEVLYPETSSEEILLDTEKNLYFITSMAIDGTSWAKKVKFFKAGDEIVDDVVEVAELIAVIKVLQQTVMEVRHAQDNGPWWYTKGERGLYMQVRLHLDRANVALNSIESVLGA